MSFFETAIAILSGPTPCKKCGEDQPLNERGHCYSCAEVWDGDLAEEEDAEEYAPSEDELRRTECTWSV
jgi:hypothetical protein